MNFKTWLENVEAKREGIKGTILNFLKDKLNLDSDEAVLSLALSSIDKSVLRDLVNRGTVNTSDDMIIQSIKNGSGTVMDLVDRLSGVAPQISSPVMLNNEGVPAGWAPAPRRAGGPFASALHKIADNMGQMPFDGNFTDTTAFQIRFGLDQNELGLLKTYGYLVRGPYGWNVDQAKFKKMYDHMMNTVRHLRAKRTSNII